MTESRYTTLYTMVISGADVIWSLSRSDNNTRYHISMSSAGVGTPLWIASDIGHSKGMTKMTGDADFYYCIIAVHCSPLERYITSVLLY